MESVVALQKDGVAGVEITVGVGFTVMVAIILLPAQPLAVGVIVIVSSTGVLPEFLAVKTAILLPGPDAPRPMPVLLLPTNRTLLPFPKF